MKRKPTPEKEKYHSRITAGRARFFDDFLAAWQALDSPATGSIDFAAPAPLLHRLGIEKAAQRRAVSRATAASWLSRFAWARGIKRGIEPAAHRVAPLLLRLVRRAS
jgi:hypothetical protein